MNPEIAGPVGETPVTVKLKPLVAVPEAVVTAILPPLVAPLGTVAVRREAALTPNEAAVPLKVTPVAPVKPLPDTVTTAPTGPDAGVNPEILGPVGRLRSR